MGTPWLALIIPAFAVLCLLCFMVMPGMVYSGEHKVGYTGVAKKYLTYTVSITEQHY